MTLHIYMSVQKSLHVDFSTVSLEIEKCMMKEACLDKNRGNRRVLSKDK